MEVQVTIDPVISSRVKAAWNRLTASQKAQLAPLMLNANQQAVKVAQTGNAPQAPATPHTLTLATTAMSGDRDAVLRSVDAAAPAVVGPDGVIWGAGKWEQFDPGWVESFAVYLESLIGGAHTFVATPQTIKISKNTLHIGLAGDWGTGDWRTTANPAPSTDVGYHMCLLNLDITIHLGDVYYAGTADQEQHLLVAIWPKGQIGSFALNSNHEMYSGANPYFQAINNPPFDQQRGCSYFALENDYWIIVGLDSAYFSPSDGLYMDGRLFPEGEPNEQNSFLLQKATEAQTNGKKLIVLTHHNGLNDAGNTSNVLFEQVINAFPGGGGPAYWYYGHEHIAAVYKPFGPTGILCRCCGHGALPWGQSSDLANSPNVVWYEHRTANDPDIPERVFNGFVVLSLDGPNIQETFYDENGGVAWQSQ
jgi:hypothetical protein